MAHNDGRIPEHADPVPSDDGLEGAGPGTTIEEMLNRIYGDRRLSFAQREFLIREIEERIESGEFGDEGADALAALVRNRGPRNPSGQAAAAADPEEPFFE